MLPTIVLPSSCYSKDKSKPNSSTPNQTTVIMKNLILILLTTLTLSCCDKDDNKSSSQLPAATTTGANTAGCLVNGQVFLRKGNSQFGPTLSCFYQQDQDGYHLGLSIVEKGSNENKSVNISANPLQLIENATYTLAQQTNNGSSYISNFGEFWITSNIVNAIQYTTTATVTGELKITKLDTQQKIISGTFWYDAINSGGEKVQVRDGRFDMRYVN